MQQIVPTSQGNINIHYVYNQTLKIFDDFKSMSNTVKDNITFSKKREDGDIIELKIVCSSSVATITSQIYVSDSLIDELICQIKQFLDGNIEEGLWANEDKGNDSTACVSLRFLSKDKLGHINIEVFAELDDGGNFPEHNCCIFVGTEYGLLMSFCESLV